MENYDKLVAALRCGEYKPECGASDCPYWSGLGCMDGQLMTDAADAIETLQKRLVNALTALHLANEKMGYYGIQPYTETDGEDMISDWVKTLVHEELTIKEREYEALKADRDELAIDLAAVGRALISEQEQQIPKYETKFSLYKTAKPKFTESQIRIDDAPTIVPAERSET